MASEVTICNLALSNIGQTANVASINPPERSPQAQLCAQFYPAARDAMLEMGAWGFATRRAVLAPLECKSRQWRHAYAMPSGVLTVLAVLPADARDDYEERLCGSLGFREFGESFNYSRPVRYTPQPFSAETDEGGKQIILTNQCEALVRYTVKVTDTTTFSPLFTLALSYLLASMLAGPIIKGDAGATEATRCLQAAKAYATQAQVSDANNSKADVEPIVPWIAGR